MELIDDPKKRWDCYSKRSSSLLKKAQDLHELTGVTVCLVIAPECGKEKVFVSPTNQILKFEKKDDKTTLSIRTFVPLKQKRKIALVPPTKKKEKKNPRSVKPREKKRAPVKKEKRIKK